jgi:hypothetical protein
MYEPAKANRAFFAFNTVHISDFFTICLKAESPLSTPE